jgi:hydrophobic/amphiphilic exporter-1 (mainly G- bacteria), HAE1 family
MSSDSRFGRSRVTVEFDDATDLDVAATDVRDAIARIRNSLPDAADEPRIVKADANADAVMRISVTSSSRSVQALTELVEDVVVDRLISLPGVADVQVYGAREPVFRVDVDLAQLASRGLTLADVRRVLADAAFDAPAGALSSRDQSLVVRATAAIASAEGFEALLLADDLRLGDVATVTLGPDPGESMLRANGQAGIGLGIVRQAQSNTLDISANVRAAVDEIDAIMPEDVGVFVSSDEAIFIEGAIWEVLKTLGLAIMIVIAIIYLFLRDARATLIPALTIPVALIGTLAAIYIVGFSVNILTLLALVLATGMVVDDAIVVLENIVRRRAEGMGPRAAAVLGTRQVFFAVVTTTATLAAVFVPLSFLPGQTGGLFREFGFTLAMAVLLSSFVALTLCPVLASKLLRAADPVARPGPVARAGRALERLFARMLAWALDAPAVIVAAAVLFGLTAVLVAGGIRSELTPPEDRAVALMSVNAPQGVSLDYTNTKMREIEELMEPLRASGEVTNIFLIAGMGGRDNRGFVVMTLAPWGERERSQAEIVAQINGMLGEVIGVQAFAIQPNSLGIRGAGRGLQFAVVGNNYGDLAEMAQAMIEAMEQDPRFGQVRLNYDTTQPQLFVSVDRERAADLGIAIDGLGEAIQAVLDGRTVGQVFVEDKSYDVKMLATTQPVNDPSDLEAIFVQTGAGRWCRSRPS